MVHSDINIIEALLTNEELQAQEGKYLEALKVLKNMNNYKSPSSESFTAEFFKIF